MLGLIADFAAIGTGLLYTFTMNPDLGWVLIRWGVPILIAVNYVMIWSWILEKRYEKKAASLTQPAPPPAGPTIESIREPLCALSRHLMSGKDPKGAWELVRAVHTASGIPVPTEV